MFQNLGLHIVHLPSGRYGYAGNLPVVLGDPIPARPVDIMAGRAWEENGAILTIKFPTFETAMQAQQHAQSRGITVTSITKR